MRCNYTLIILFILILSLISITSAAVTQYNSTDGNYTVIKFNGTGSINWTPPAGVSNISYLIVAGGGGGGGGGNGGGGGAGGMLVNSSFNISGTYTIIVGNYGSGSGSNQGGDGGQSSIQNATYFMNATGGGGGGGSTTTSGRNGGSGGGVSFYTGTRGSGIAGQGNNGGTAQNINPSYPSGGGGGAGGAGGNGAGSDSGVGGAGNNSSITGTNVTYAGGGGGGSGGGDNPRRPGAGGSGGGGAGACQGSCSYASTAGTNGLGGGGGGGTTGGFGGANGGTGVVIIRYNTPQNATTSSFTSNISSGITPLAVQFNDTSSENPTEWNWSFNNVTGNNTEIWFNTTQNPLKIFGVGNYSIKLNTSNSGGSNITPGVYYINVSIAPPVAEFAQTKTEGATPLLVGFTDMSTGDQISWNWTFGGANFSDLQSPTYTFTGVGNYTVILNVSNTVGWDNVTHYVNVTSPPPVADFTMSNESGDTPLLVNFTDISTNTPTTWNWSFNGTNFSEDKNPNYIFIGLGNYTVILNVSNYAGWDNVTHYVNVTETQYSTHKTINDKILDTQTFIISGIYLMVGAVIIGFIATLFGTKP